MHILGVPDVEDGDGEDVKALIAKDKGNFDGPLGLGRHILSPVCVFHFGVGIDIWKGGKEGGRANAMNRNSSVRSQKATLIVPRKLKILKRQRTSTSM